MGSVSMAQDQRPSAQVVNFQDAQARRFLRKLRDNPFICLVFHEGQLEIFEKGAKPEHLRKIVAAMDAADRSDD